MSDKIETISTSIMSDADQHSLKAVFPVIAAGTVSGWCGVLVGHPMDSMKVRIQVNRPFQIGKHSVLSLYRGIAPPLLSTAVLQSLNFTLYENIKSRYYNQLEYSYLSSCFIGAAVAGCVLSLFTAPFSLIKVQQQLNSDKNMIACARDQYNQYGLKVFYRGYTNILIQESIGRGMYFYTYEGCKMLLTKETDAEQQPLATKIAAAAIAGCFSWFSIFPFDVVRTKLQSDSGGVIYRSALHCMKYTYKEGGIRAFYRGLFFTMIRAGPVSAVILPTYEYVKLSLT